VLLPLLSLLACPKTTETEALVGPHGRCGPQDDGSKTVVVLHINDVYRMGGLPDGRGGLARVRTLRQQLEAECGGPVVLTHGGDVLFPSMLSHTFDGRQKVEVLNLLDGDPLAQDPYMVAVFGNHEFDRPKLKDAGHLDALLDRSQFTWLDTNVRWVPSAGVESAQLAERVLLDVNGVKIGLFGITTDLKKPQYALIDTEHAKLASGQSQALRDEGAEVVIALTHLDIQQDMELLHATSDGAGPDLVLGGQDHHEITEDAGGGRFVLKGQADAVKVRAAWITVAADGSVSVEPETYELSPEKVAPDPAVAGAVQAWTSAFELSYCGDDYGSWGCLDEVYGKAGTSLVGDELVLRQAESNLGSWVADSLKSSFEGAQVGLVNAGALRLNSVIPQGQDITRQTLEELLPYDDDVVLVEMSGAQLKDVLEHAVQGWPSSGQFLQVSGVVFRHDVAAGTVTHVHLVTDEGLVQLEDEAEVRVATVIYLVDPSKGDQDGFGAEDAGALNMSSVRERKPSLRGVLVEGLKAAGEAGITPVAEGRICNSDAPEGSPCLVPASE
jgi:2',3'-cyclic-nucleotide 2'-phosphodiesterase (5'-nucleotidase family)